jgi:hypothetical protein
MSQQEDRFKGKRLTDVSAPRAQSFPFHQLFHSTSGKKYTAQETIHFLGVRNIDPELFEEVGLYSSFGVVSCSSSKLRKPERNSRIPRPNSPASITGRTAVYGPVRTVVWEGLGREALPYPDWMRKRYGRKIFEKLMFGP